MADKKDINDVDYLEPTVLKCGNQRYALISIIGPDSPQKHDQCAIKIYGTFSEQDEANKHAQKLREIEPNFNIYLVEMYNWLAIPPDPNTIEDQDYTDKTLNEIVKGHIQNQRDAAKEFEVRKAEMIENAIKESEQRKEESKEESKGESSSVADKIEEIIIDENDCKNNDTLDENESSRNEA